MNKIDFFTPVVFNFEQKNTKQKMMEFVEGYFSLGQRVAKVYRIREFGRSFEAQIEAEDEAKQKLLTTVVKIISYITVILPLIALIAKGIFRFQHPIHLTPQQAELQQLGDEGLDAPQPARPQQPGIDNRHAALPEEAQQLMPRSELSTRFLEMARDLNWGDAEDLQSLINVIDTTIPSEGDKENARINKEDCRGLLTEVLKICDGCRNEQKEVLLRELRLSLGHCIQRLQGVCINFHACHQLPENASELVPYIASQFRNEILFEMTGEFNGEGEVVHNHHVNFANACRIRIGQAIRLSEESILRAERDEHAQAGRYIFIERIPRERLMREFLRRYSPDALIERITDILNDPMRDDLRNSVIMYLSDLISDQEVEEAGEDDVFNYLGNYFLQANPHGKTGFLNRAAVERLAAEELEWVRGSDRLIEEAIVKGRRELDQLQQPEMNRAEMERRWAEADEDLRRLAAIEEENRTSDNENDLSVDSSSDSE